MFRPVSAELEFVALEEAELARWRANNVFERSMKLREGAEPWVFYEGPPTANGVPGLHHVWARVYKDLFCRYHTMRGRSVARRAGGDTHGLPVEVQVEKQLGVSGKKMIEEKVGVAEFTRLCRESVLAPVGEFERLTDRIGYWTDESAYVILALTDASNRTDLSGATHLAVWTTTPWTLLSNVAVAMNPEVTYAVVDGVVVAEDLITSVFGERARASGTFKGSALQGVHYQRPFDDVPLPEGVDTGYVVAAEYVTTDDGTGLVHQAPGFGEIDRLIAREYGLPTLNPVGPDGTFSAAVAWLDGKHVRDTNQEINDELDRRGLLIRRFDYTHSLPHCWRCGTVLIYWAKPSWYVATSKFKDQMLSENSTVDWHPAHIRDGRMGEWLANNVDWALSRDRYWGTPLPIWGCEGTPFTCVGSRDELSVLTGRDLSDVEPHRPEIDEVVFSCPTCAKEARRVEPVIDARFDAGSLPPAPVGYPHVPGSAEAMQFPAQFIAEAIDQTRGWFYTLLAVNTLVFGAKPYEHVLC